MSRNTTIIASVAVAAVTIASATVLAKARSGADPRIDATSNDSLKTLRRTRPSGGRHTRRRDPLARPVKGGGQRRLEVAAGEPGEQRVGDRVGVFTHLDVMHLDLADVGPQQLGASGLRQLVGQQPRR